MTETFVCDGCRTCLCLMYKTVLLQTELGYPLGTFRDIQGRLNDQFQVVSDLFTGISLCLKLLSYSEAMFWYSTEMWLARSWWATISYSKDMSEISYLASFFTPDDMITQS